MTYVQYRAKRYEFRYRLPEDLAGKPVPEGCPATLRPLISPGAQRFKREIIRSLQTKDVGVANRRVLTQIAEAHALVDDARRFLVEGPQKGIRPDQIKRLVAEFENRVLTNDEEARRNGFFRNEREPELADGMNEEDFESYSSMVDFVDQETGASLARMRPHAAASDAVDSSLDRHGIVLAENDPARRELELEFMKALRRALDMMQARSSGEVVETPALPKSSAGLTLTQALERWEAGGSRGAKKPREMSASEAHWTVQRFVQLRKQGGEYSSLAIYLERPRVANKLDFLELHKYVVRLIGRDRIQAYCNRVNEIVTEMAESLAADAGMAAAKDKSSFRQEAVDRLKHNDGPMLALLNGGADDSARVYAFLLGESAAEGREYESRVDSDFMAAKVLSDLFRVLTSDLKPGSPILESVYLFIDEGEMLVDAKATESELVFSGLRELINGIPYRFCLLISFSAATALIEAIMPNHLLKRMTRHYVEIPMLSDDEAIDFLRTQIAYFRPEGYVAANPFYPFDDHSIRYIVENETTLTPRNLFMDCKRVLERAIRRHGLAPGETITRETAEAVLSNLR